MIKKIFFLFAVLFLSYSCSSDDNGSKASNTEGSVLVRGTLTFNNGTVFTSRYTYEGRRLVKITADDRFTDYTYSGERITKAETYDNNNVLLAKVLFEYYPTGKIKRSLTTLSSGNIISYVYVNNPDGSVAVTRYIGSEIEENIDNIGYLYFENGEMVKKVMTKVGQPTVTYNFTYDDKNNPRRFNPGYYEISYYLDFSTYAVGNQHNLLSVNKENDYSYTLQYEYNSENYPIKTTRIDINGNAFDGVNEYFYR